MTSSFHIIHMSDRLLYGIVIHAISLQVYAQVVQPAKHPGSNVFYMRGGAIAFSFSMLFLIISKFK